MSAKLTDGVNGARTAGRAMPMPETDTACFVINLCSSMMPLSRADVPDAPLLRKHKLYASRRKEDGRERYRLHLGFFSSDTEALRVATELRDSFPTAWVVRANGDDLRHLMRRQPAAPAPAPAKPEPVPPPPVIDAPTPSADEERLELRTAPAVDEPDVNGLLEAFDASEADAAPDGVYHGPAIPGAAERAKQSPPQRQRPKRRPATARKPKKIEVPEDGTGAFFGLSDSQRVKHLSVKPMEPSITARILRKFMKLRKDPDDPGH